MVGTNDPFSEARMPPKDPTTPSMSLTSSASTLLEAYGMIYSEQDAQQIADITQKIREAQLDEVSSDFTVFSLRKPFFIHSKEQKLYKSICLYLLKHCVENLHVMMEGHKLNMVKRPRGSLLYRTLSERFQDDKDIYDNFVIGVSYSNWDKLQTEIGYLISIIEDVWAEFNMYSITTTLQVFAQAHTLMVGEEAQLLAEVEGKKQTIKNLLKALSSFRDASSKRLKNLDSLIDQTAKSIVDVERNAKDEMKYLESWEQSRNEQNAESLRRREVVHEGVILGVNQKMRDDLVVHENVTIYYENSREEIFNEIGQLMEKYEKDFDKRDLDIYNMKHKIAKVKESRQELQNVYDERERAMKDYLEYKTIKKEKQKRLFFETRAARKIQEWWRAQMVIIRERNKKKGKKGTKKDKKVGTRERKKTNKE